MNLNSSITRSVLTLGITGLATYLTNFQVTDHEVPFDPQTFVGTFVVTLVLVTILVRILARVSQREAEEEQS